MSDSPRKTRRAAAVAVGVLSLTLAAPAAFADESPPEIPRVPTTDITFYDGFEELFPPDDLPEHAFATTERGLTFAPDNHWSLGRTSPTSVMVMDYATTPEERLQAFEEAAEYNAQVAGVSVEDFPSKSPQAQRNAAMGAAGRLGLGGYDNSRAGLQSAWPDGVRDGAVELMEEHHERSEAFYEAHPERVREKLGPQGYPDGTVGGAPTAAGDTEAESASGPDSAPGGGSSADEGNEDVSDSEDPQEPEEPNAGSGVAADGEQGEPTLQSHEISEVRSAEPANNDPDHADDAATDTDASPGEQPSSVVGDALPQTGAGTAALLLSGLAALAGGAAVRRAAR